MDGERPRYNVINNHASKNLCVNGLTGRVTGATLFGAAKAAYHIIKRLEKSNIDRVLTIMD